MTAGVRPSQVGIHPPGANSGNLGGFDATMTSAEFKQWLLQNLISADVTLFSDIVNYTEATTAATDLGAYTIPGGMLSQNGEGIDFFFAGITAATANNKTVLASYGGTTIITTGALAANASPWYLEGKIIRVAPGVQEIIVDGMANGAVVTPTRTVGAIDMTVDQILKLNATSATAAGGLTQTIALIKKIGQFNLSLGA